MAFLAVTVMARSKSGGKQAWRQGRRHPLGQLRIPRSSEHGRPAAGANAAPEAQLAAHIAEPQAQAVSNAGTTQDRATYSCQCGFVFEATVMTTVDCPHCQTPQAW
jgi:hypothetical protein